MVDAPTTATESDSGSEQEATGSSTPPADPATLDQDGDGYTGSLGCDSDSGVHPGGADEPDMAFTGASCDGVDGNVSRAGESTGPRV